MATELLRRLTLAALLCAELWYAATWLDVFWRAALAPMRAALGQ